MVGSFLLASTLSGSYGLWFAAQVVAIVIIVVLVLRWRPGFLGKRTIGETLNQSLDARAARIQDQLEAAQRSREEAARIHEESQREIAQARQQAEEIVTRATSTSEAIQHEIEERAKEEYNRIVGQARNQINYERQQAEVALRRRAADIVVDAAGQVVERYLEPQSDRRIIDDSLTNLRKVE
jgi:F-type H+-transporting ATPase subunit b